MTMTRDEAARIALGQLNHAAVTFDLAAQKMEEAGEPALRQLCEAKAAMVRADGWLGKADTDGARKALRIKF